jgi:hypothetical protein
MRLRIDFRDSLRDFSLHHLARLLTSILVLISCGCGSDKRQPATPDKPAGIETESLPATESTSESPQITTSATTDPITSAAPVSYSGDSHALLIGCTKYDHLGETSNLRGPTNDVDMMRDVLISRFGFDSNLIRTLTEDSKANGRPIKENITRELGHLAHVAGEGDRVVILLSGHGSQQPDNDFDNPEDPEPDGLDEIFCPADIDFATSEESPFAKNALTDDELRSAITAVRDKGAFVWVIVDACHSGSAVRGNEVYRQLAPEFLVSPKAIATARRKAGAGTRGLSQEDSGMDAATTQGGLVAIYAAQSHEPTLEMMLPDQSDESEWRGLLTYTMIQVLTTAETPVSYRELVQRIHNEYVQTYGRLGPTPLIEGVDQHRQILEQTEIPARSEFVLAAPSANDTTDLPAFALNGGRIHGFTKGSIFAVFPPPGETASEAPLGHVQIVNARLANSVVVPVEFNGLPIQESLPVGGRVQPVEVQIGDLALKVTVETPEGTDPAADPIAEVLRQIEQDPEQRLRLVTADQATDWIVRRSDSDEYFLVPAEGWSKVPDETNFGPAPASDQLEWFRERLGRISRVKSLLKLCDASSKQSTGLFSALLGARKACEIKLTLNSVSEDSGELEPIKWTKEKWKLADGSQVLLEIENTGTESVDFSVLFIDSKFGITSLFPAPGVVADNRIEPGQTYPVGPMQVESTTLGLEHLLVIATRADGQPIDFSWLSQNALEAAQRSTITGSGGESGNSLNALLQDTLFSKQSVRGMKMADAESTCMRVISWQTVPNE